MKTILVCGGCGFIGSNFVRYLYNKYPDYKLINLDLLTYSGNRDNLADIERRELGVAESSSRYSFIHGDIGDKNLLEQIFINEKLDIVVNFAAESHVDRSLYASYDFIHTNIMGTHALTEECRRYKIPRFVQISTDEVYGDVPEGYSAEEAALNPSNPYAASKAGADVIIKSYMRSHKLPALIVRGSNNFGPYQYPEKLIPLAISNFLDGEKIPIHGSGAHVRHWIYVFDFCNGIDLAIHRGKDYNIYNIGGVPRTNLQVLESVRSALNLPHPLDHYKSHTNDRPGADLRYAPDTAKSSRELGWSLEHDFDSALKSTVQWYLENKNWWGKIKRDKLFIEHYRRQEKADYY